MSEKRDAVLEENSVDAAQAPSNQLYRVCAVSEFPDDEVKHLHEDGHHIALFKYDGEFYATDNRCPHMGYPLVKGSVRDGVLICHWHHWEFDLKSGACFAGGGDDVKTFPVVVKDGDIFVELVPESDAEFRRQLIERGRRALSQGMKNGSTFMIAKAVTALRASGMDVKGIIHDGLVYGAQKSPNGWSGGLATLTLAGNMWSDVGCEEHNLFLVHGLSKIGQQTSGRSTRRPQFPFPGKETFDLVTLKRWFRRFVEHRNATGAERILMTLYDRGHPREVIADFIFTAATDFYYTGRGHALDFGNKTLEALDAVGWDDAFDILRPIAVDLVSRVRHEEDPQWEDSVPVLEDVFTRLDIIWQENQNNAATLNISEFAGVLLQDDFRIIVAEIEKQLRAGVLPLDICRAMTYAGALRVVRFHLKNEGDWHAVANFYSYSHALYRAFHIAPSEDLLRGIFHGVVVCTFLRWLNMPSARVPRPDEMPDESFSDPDSMLTRLQEMADYQKVMEAELIVNQYLADGLDIRRLKQALARIMLREDAELHMFQVLEVAYIHYDLSSDDEEKRIHLLAATRYITAQKVMKGVLWSTDNAEKLQRGELLSERDD